MPFLSKIFSTRLVIIVVLFCFQTFNSSAQVNPTESDSATTNKRLNKVLIGGSVVYVASMAGFYELWYKEFETTTFHSFNDNSEWLQMDKIGHVGTSYQLSKWGQRVFIWTGLPDRKAAWYGAG
ncbi:MAG: hypothetical protein KJO64_01160, partial [Bacteroidia bacterium]|nr:hypothetical protein [Bacteroidia bacterium]